MGWKGFGGNRDRKKITFSECCLSLEFRLFNVGLLNDGLLNDGLFNIGLLNDGLLNIGLFNKEV